MSKIQIKKRKTHELHFTKFELLHLRDMLGVVLPPNTNKTLSQHLAELENRVLIESALWNKISSACSEAGLPVGDQAPDYIVAPISSPAMGIFQLASEPSDDSGQEPSAGFIHDSPGDE